ncbi:MAG TPA: helix-turn-helix domain-containing protein, partial [Methylomirabilota bacterium]|nr:helix-turn-helix domain-containing protein [Methylomirabilota bacterium]
YRLNVLSINLPPLRERREDIPLLIDAFIEEFNAKYDKQAKAVDDAALKILMAYPWPGNIRELRNTIERAVIACNTALLDRSCLPPNFAAPAAPSAGSGDSMQVTIGTQLREAEKQLILQTLAAANNNKTRAAEILGISLKTLQNKLHRYHQPPGAPPQG